MTKQIPWNKGTKGICKTNSGSFKKGFVPWNKGKTGYKNKTGNYNTNSGFQKGHKIFNKGTTWSEKCKIKRSADRQGIKVSEWTGYISELNHILRNSSLCKIWREAIFLRDNFTCQNSNCKYCNNIMGVTLNAHHIKKWSTNTSLRFKIENGITYCEDFHLKSGLHKIQKEVI